MKLATVYFNAIRNGTLFPRSKSHEIVIASECLYGLQFKTVCYYFTVCGTATCVLISAPVLFFGELFHFFQELDHNFQTLFNKFWYYLIGGKDSGGNKASY
jgi:hypothetical protein